MVLSYRARNVDGIGSLDIAVGHVDVGIIEVDLRFRDIRLLLLSSRYLHSQQHITSYTSELTREQSGREAWGMTSHQ